MTRLIKTKAIVEITLLIIAIFFIGLETATAQNIQSPTTTPSTTLTFSTQPSTVCCEKTKTGESCVYTSSSNCDGNARTSQQECSQTSFCQTGCCFNQDGTCASAASKATCESKGSTFNLGISCQSIPLCKKGCCTIGNNYFLSTKQLCAEKSKAFPKLKANFDASINDELSCTKMVQNKEKGCCIQDLQCIYIDRDSCLGNENTIPSSGSSTLTQNPAIIEGRAPAPETGMAIIGSTQPANIIGSSQEQSLELMFESGKFCSSVSICGCKPKHHKGCNDGDVYWFDSCGNRENKVHDCDFAKNTLCSSKTLSCESLDCKNTFDKKAINGADIVDYDGIPRKNGESWCEYDGSVGLGQDLVGSRHYRHLCINGEEFIEPCKDFREEFCMQVMVETEYGNMLEAACRPNNYKGCSIECNTAKEKKKKGQIQLAMQKDKDCCQDPEKTCFWVDANKKEVQTINSDAKSEIAANCANMQDANQNPACTSKAYEIAEENNGVCMPLVPPGLKFWKDPNEASSSGQQTAPQSTQQASQQSKSQTSTADAEKTCEVGTKKCTVHFYKNMMTGWKWKVAKGSDQCLKTKFIISSMSYCKSLGDCGPKYNIAGRFSSLGYDCETSDGSCKGSKHGKSYDMININWEKEIGGFDSYTKANAIQLKNVKLGAYKGFGIVPTEMWLAFGAGAATIVGILGIGLATTSLTLSSLGVMSSLSFVAGVGSGLLGIGTTSGAAAMAAFAAAGGGAAAATGASTAAATAAAAAAAVAPSAVGATAGASLAGTLGTVLGTIAAAVPYLAIAVVIIAILMTITSFIGADSDKLDVTISCLPWQAPYGSNDCEKCSNQEILKSLNFDTCSEYKCKSLGQNCKWIQENEGSNRTSCVAINVNDVSTPRIRPWPEVLTQGYSLTEFSNGYEVTPAAEGYSLITFGILINKAATCKYAQEPGIKYDAMSSDFGDPYFDIKHMITVTAIASQLNELYVKCKDANGNANAADYLIKFNAKAGKDLTPPIILESSIQDSASITSSSTPISLQISEPAQCKYSTADSSYEQMQNSLSCNTDSSVTSPSARFYCNGLLNIHANINTFYFRCRDNNGNTNQESYVLNLNGDSSLGAGLASGLGKFEITSTSPLGELDTNLIIIEATTAGGSNNGIATCSYTLNSKKTDFENTNSNSHSSELPQLMLSKYDIPIECHDLEGSIASATISFKIRKDNTPPRLMFLYKQASTLVFETDEASACEYSTKEFKFGEGIKIEGADKLHTLEIERHKYTIVCIDEFNNITEAFTVYP